MTSAPDTSTLTANTLEAFAARFGPVPERHAAAVHAYLSAVDLAALPDVFDMFTADDLREAADHGGATATNNMVRAQLAYLATWHTALDALDADLRDARGHHDDQTRAIITGLAGDLFTATQTLHRAVMTHHYGDAGPHLDPAYGHAYALSNGTVRPFGD